MSRGLGCLPAPKYIVVVYKVLSIYRVLPGFREFAVFEKSKRFFYIFFLDGYYIEGVRALARAQIYYKLKLTNCKQIVSCLEII